MNKMKSTFISRHGIDQLNIALLIITLIMAATTLIIESNDMRLLCWFPFMYCIYRLLSKQHIARYKENVRFMKFLSPILKPMYVKIARVKDKQHKYCQCPSCKQTIRIIKAREKTTFSCPMCKSEFIK